MQLDLIDNYNVYNRATKYVLPQAMMYIVVA